jgi:toxin ParE1/3/4
MIDFRVSPQAAADLEEVWDYIALDDRLAADKIIGEFLIAFRQLVETPRMGRQRDDLSPGLRSLGHGNYLVLYNIKYEIINIVRVVHGARDLNALFHPDI